MTGAEAMEEEEDTEEEAVAEEEEAEEEEAAPMTSAESRTSEAGGRAKRKKRRQRKTTTRAPSPIAPGERRYAKIREVAKAKGGWEWTLGERGNLAPLRVQPCRAKCATSVASGLYHGVRTTSRP